MGQQDVLQYLNELRQKSDKWLDTKEIKNDLITRGFSNGSLNGLSDDLFKLTAFNMIEMKGEGFWKHKKFFRGMKSK